MFFLSFFICFCDFEKNRKGVGKWSAKSLLSEKKLWGNKLLMLENKREVTWWLGEDDEKDNQEAR
jgi:hypothetical protein